MIAIIGLGYVGLPLAVEFGKKQKVVGFDIDIDRVEELNRGIDRTLENSEDEIKASKHLRFSSCAQELRQCTVFIVTVPTPVDKSNRPDLAPLINASRTVGGVMPKGATVIYESTVYPGATEEICVPILEEISGGKFNTDFFCGYSPERINPGDKKHRLVNIKKVTSGSTEEIANYIDELYKTIILAGTHKARTIKIAEAAKVIENIQRDVNIALVNELSLIFHRLNIDTLEVLEAAGTKWNFLPFRPGLVGGHCIGVDPYYLTHKAQEVGYHPEVILAGRRVNNFIVTHIADELIKVMLKKRLPVLNSRILVMGITFKENCPDTRNSKVIDLINELKSYNTSVDIYDPWADQQKVFNEYSLNCYSALDPTACYDAVILAVGHAEFVEMGEHGIKQYGKENSVLYDVKGVLPLGAADGRL